MEKNKVNNKEKIALVALNRFKCDLPLNDEELKILDCFLKSKIREQKIIGRVGVGFFILACLTIFILWIF